MPMTKTMSRLRRIVHIGGGAAIPGTPVGRQIHEDEIHAFIETSAEEIRDAKVRKRGERLKRLVVLVPKEQNPTGFSP